MAKELTLLTLLYLIILDEHLWAQKSHESNWKEYFLKGISIIVAKLLEVLWDNL